MKERKLCGQEATEFVLISILLFFSALTVVFIFSGKLANFFNADSSAVQIAKGKSNVINTTTNQKYNTNLEAYTGPVKATGGYETGNIITLGGQQVTENTDGSLSFVVSGQNVTISTQMKDLANAVFVTTGSSGANDLIKEIAYMIEKHKAEYPTTNVPVEVSYGDGARSYTSYPTSTYKGSATALANSVTINVGNHMVVLQKDQTCVGGIGSTCNYKGQYRIEGNASTGLFTGDVTRTDSATPNQTYGTFNSTVNLTNGIEFSNAQYYQKNVGLTYNWSLNFTNPANKFNI